MMVAVVIQYLIFYFFLIYVKNIILLSYYYLNNVFLFSFLTFALFLLRVQITTKFRIEFCDHPHFIPLVTIIS